MRGGWRRLTPRLRASAPASSTNALVRLALALGWGWVPAGVQLESSHMSSRSQASSQCWWRCCICRMRSAPRFPAMVCGNRAYCCQLRADLLEGMHHTTAEMPEDLRGMHK